MFISSLSSCCHFNNVEFDQHLLYAFTLIHNDMTLIKVDHVINSHIILCAIKRIDSSLPVACDNGINGEWKIERRENSNWEDIKLRVNSVDTNEIHNLLSNAIKSSECGFQNSDANEIIPYMVISDGNKIKNLNFNWTFPTDILL